MGPRIQILIGTGLFILLIVLAVFAFKTREGFQDPATDRADELTANMTLISEALCPAFQGIVQDAKTNVPDVPKDQQEAKALQALTEEAKGPLFPCPPPNDPYAVPADIGERVRRSTTFIQTKLNKGLEDIKISLNCKATEGFTSSSVDHLEAFQDVCTAQQLAERKAQEQQKASASCIAPQDLTPETKAYILNTRADGLASFLKEDKTAILFAQIQQSYQELQSIKNRAQSGTLGSSCPV